MDYQYTLGQEEDSDKPQKFESKSTPISTLLGNIVSGELGLPELQRPFVWTDKKVRDLFDSMKQGYPIGYIMLWRYVDEGNRPIGTTARGRVSEVIIDGQQRLTSLYAVMKGKPVRDSKYQERKIKISYNPLTDRFEVANSATKQSPEWIYNISAFYTATHRGCNQLENEYIDNVNNFRKETGKSTLTEEEQETISKRISELINLRDTATIPIIELKGDLEEESVADIFVRVNSAGIALKQNDFILTLLSVYWEEGRRKIEKFSRESAGKKTVSEDEESEEDTSWKLITDVSPQDIIRVVMAYAFNRGRLKYGYKLLRGADFDKKGEISEQIRNDRLGVLKEKLEDVIKRHNWHEFLGAIRDAGYRSEEMILSKNAIFCSYALYLIAKNRIRVKNRENLHITALWFFYVLLTSAYSTSFESKFEQQLSDLDNIKAPEEYKNYILKTIEEDLSDYYFDNTLVGTNGLEVSGKGNNAWNAYIAALNVLNAGILFSKRNRSLRELFEPDIKGNRKSLEKHHLFPKAYLKRKKNSQGKEYTDKEINQMANYAYIDWNDNIAILDTAPEEYYAEIREVLTEEQRKSMEEENALPSGWEKMDYENFLMERRKLMAAKIKAAYEKLRSNIENS